MLKDNKDYIRFMQEKHKNQKRIQGTPYYLHPLEVSNILAKKGFSKEYQIAGLFHDLLEDTNTTYEEIVDITNVEIAEAVRLVTKEEGYVMSEYMERIKQNDMARMVKLADRIHNLSETHLASSEFKEKYIKETEEWFIDLATGTIFEEGLKRILEEEKEGFMEENYIEKYKDIILKISVMENTDGKDNPWYSDEYRCPALEKLMERFPNLSFSKGDLFKLRNFAGRKEKNDLEIYELLDYAYGYSFYERKGHRMTKGEKERQEKARHDEPSINKNYVKAFSTFFSVCENLNDSKILENPEFNIENEVFSRIYDYNFELSPKNPMLKNYYQTYKAYRKSQEENKKLSEQNKSLTQQVDEANEHNSNLGIENENLEKKFKELQKMLSKTLDFCNTVRNSRFGKFFFRKKIKELPALDSAEREIDE